jgi:hypothetical protein
MIEMCMCQHDRVQLLKGPFLRNTIMVLDPARALKQPEVNKDVGLPGLHQICRPRDFPTAGAKNGDLHFIILQADIAVLR